MWVGDLVDHVYRHPGTRNMWVGDLVDHVYRHPGTRNMWVGDLVDQGILKVGAPRSDR
jgi:hypothetical protein